MYISASVVSNSDVAPKPTMASYTATPSNDAISMRHSYLMNVVMDPNTITNS